MLAAVGHRQPADEVGQPRVGGALLLRVLVQVVVDLPALVGDPQVVVGLADEVVEDHEVGDQDLVHAPPRLEAVQVVLGRLGLDVARLVGQVAAGRVDALAGGLERRGHRVLGEPVDLEVGMQVAQLAGDRDVAPGVAEADRRRDVERALAAAAAARPAPRRRPRRDEVAQQQVDPDRVARVRAVPGALERDERRRRSPPRAARRRRTAGPRRRVPWMTSTGHGSARTARANSSASFSARPSWVSDQRLGVVSSPQPTQSSSCLVECGSVKNCEKKNSRKSR